MTRKLEKLGCVVVLTRFLIQIPLTFGLMFLILRHINATELMWVLFWISAPLSLAITIVAELLKDRLSKQDR
jgi:hypothetical protein